MTDRPWILALRRAGPVFVVLVPLLLAGCSYSWDTPYLDAWVDPAPEESSTPPVNARSNADTPTRDELFDPLPDSNTDPLVIKPGDELVINVVGEEWGGTHRVPPTGRIDFKFIGPITVTGRTLDELKPLLLERLQPEYFLEPDLQVNFKSVSKIRVLVMGQVGRPDHVELPRNEGVMNAIVEAGYLTRNSIRTRMYIFRSNNGDTAVYHANYEQYARGDLSQNVPLKEGDLVYVRTQFWPHFDTLDSVLQTLGFAAGTADALRDVETRN